MRTDKEKFLETRVLIRIDFAKYEDTSFSRKSSRLSQQISNTLLNRDN